MAQKKLPSVMLRAGEDRRVRAGHPWAFSNEILMDAEAKAMPPGSLATLRAPGGEALGLVTFNPHSLIAAPRAVDQSRGHGRCPVPRPAACPGDGPARPAGRRSLLPADPCRGRRPARRDRRPLRRRAGRAGQHRRHGTADAGAARGAGGRAVAQDDRAQERFAGARARGAEARDDGGQGRCRAADRAGRERREVRRRPVGWPEDRLVLRPARQPALHGGLREGRQRARRLQLLRRLRRAGGGARREVGDSASTARSPRSMRPRRRRR